MHLGYALETPVHRNVDSLSGPLRKLSDVADRLTYHLGGDIGYGGSITRNPMNPGPGMAVHWNAYLPYSLGQLDKALPKTKTRPGERLTGIGRNVDLFGAMVKEAHQPRWHRLIESEGWGRAHGSNHVRSENVHDVVSRRAARVGVFAQSPSRARSTSRGNGAKSGSRTGRQRETAFVGMETLTLISRLVT